MHFRDELFERFFHALHSKDASATAAEETVLRRIRRSSLREKLEECFGREARSEAEPRILQASDQQLRAWLAMVEVVGSLDELWQVPDTAMTIAEEYIDKGRLLGLRSVGAGRFLEGFLLGQLHMLQLAIEMRFGADAVSNDVAQRLASASHEQIRVWASRLSSANSLDELFSESPVRREKAD